MHNIPHTPELKYKMSLSQKGRIAWNKGKKMSKNYKEICRLRQLGKKIPIGLFINKNYVYNNTD